MTEISSVSPNDYQSTGIATPAEHPKKEENISVMQGLTSQNKRKIPHEKTEREARNAFMDELKGLGRDPNIDNFDRAYTIMNSLKEQLKNASTEKDKQEIQALISKCEAIQYNIQNKLGLSNVEYHDSNISSDIDNTEQLNEHDQLNLLKDLGVNMDNINVEYGNNGPYFKDEATGKYYRCEIVKKDGKKVNRLIMTNPKIEKTMTANVDKKGILTRVIDFVLPGR